MIGFYVSFLRICILKYSNQTVQIGPATQAGSFKFQFKSYKWGSKRMNPTLTEVSCRTVLDYSRAEIQIRADRRGVMKFCRLANYAVTVGVVARKDPEVCTSRAIETPKQENGSVGHTR